MIIPVRCFTCGKPIAQDWDEYLKKVSEGNDPEEVLNKLGYERYCCRRMFLSHSEIIDETMHYKKI